MSPWKLNRLCHDLANGAVIGYPTDTIWGFGCHPLNAISVARILHIKQRDPAQGLILLASQADQIKPYIEASAAGDRIIVQATDRPTTWLVPASPNCPAWIRGAHPTVAVRISDHPLVLALCERLQGPLVSTSANRSGESTVRSALQMRRRFGSELDCIVSGYTAGGRRASEIKSLASGNITRPG